MNAKQRRQKTRFIGRLYDIVRVGHKAELTAILDHLERYPKTMVMVQIQGMIEQRDVPFKRALEEHPND